MARSVYLQHRTYLMSVGTAVDQMKHWHVLRVGTAYAAHGAQLAHSVGCADGSEIGNPPRSPPTILLSTWAFHVFILRLALERKSPARSGARFLRVLS